VRFVLRTRSLVLCVMFCRSLSVCSFYLAIVLSVLFIWPLCCLFYTCTYMRAIYSCLTPREWFSTVITVRISFFFWRDDYERKVLSSDDHQYQKRTPSLTSSQSWLQSKITLLELNKNKLLACRCMYTVSWVMDMEMGLFIVLILMYQCVRELSLVFVYLCVRREYCCDYVWFMDLHQEGQ
jgi:hypothetical protein